jgi:hypothetical protein
MQDARRYHTRLSKENEWNLAGFLMRFPFHFLRWASLQFVALLLVARDMVGYDGPDVFEEGKPGAMTLGAQSRTMRLGRMQSRGQ